MHEELGAAVRITPAAFGTAWAWIGLSLNELVALATLIYVVAQIGLLIPRYWTVLRMWWNRKHRP